MLGTMLWVRGLLLEGAAEDWQLEVLEQASLWLGLGSVRAGLLVSSGCPSLEQVAKGEGYTHIHCFTHCLDSLVRNFLCHHQCPDYPGHCQGHLQPFIKLCGGPGAPHPAPAPARPPGPPAS